MRDVPQGWSRYGYVALLQATLLPLMLMAGCSSLLPAKAPAPSFYSLDSQRSPAAPPLQPNGGQSAAIGGMALGPTLVITPPHAAPGFDRPRIVYVRQPHKIEYFSENQWVETPARMLAPMLVSALERSGGFRAVLQTPSVATGEVRLDTEILRLQQEFLASPSQVRFTLRARLVDDVTRKVIASSEFEGLVGAKSEDAYGGVLAANQAVATVLDELAAFCVQNTRALGATAALK